MTAKQAKSVEADAANPLRSAFATIRFRSKTLNILRRTLHQRGLRESDGLIACFPRSGSTWLRFMITEVLSGESATFGLVTQAIPYMGWQANALPLLENNGRLIQTHELRRPLDLRALYLVRDPRDVALSYYRWQLRYGVFSGTFEDFLPHFLRGTASPFAAWNEHVMFWQKSLQRNRDASLLVKYEDLRLNPEETLAQALAFFGFSGKEAEIRAANHNNSLANMQVKERQATPEDFMLKPVHTEIPFVGSGSIGGWKSKMDPAHVERIESKFSEVMSALGYAFTTR